MAFCQNCGNEVSGNFCPNCGSSVSAPIAARPSPYEGRTIIEEAEIKSRYHAGHMALAYPGLLFTFIFLFCAIGLPLSLDFSGDIGTQLGIMLFSIIGSGFVMAIFMAWPVLSIFKKSPKGEKIKTFIAYIFKSILFYLSWIISCAFCCFLIGLFLGAWRIGVAASRPLDKHYTVFIDGKKIGVERKVDHELTTPFETHYIYEDADGILYRPPLYND